MDMPDAYSPRDARPDQIAQGAEHLTITAQVQWHNLIESRPGKAYGVMDWAR
jgi:hypothetical protein